MCLSSGSTEHNDRRFQHDQDIARKSSVLYVLKIHLNPGEAKTVSVRLDEEAFRYYDPIDRRFVVEPGTFTVHVGASSADIRLSGKLEVPSGKY